jgi:hypothetical protein
MKRRINSTNRQKISADSIKIRLEDTAIGGTAFSADLSGITLMKLDPQAPVVVEAFVGTSTMRFDFGTVGALVPPIDRSLLELDRGGLIQFRIKVIDPQGVHGRLLAASRNLHALDEADEADDRRSLLPLKEIDLGDAVWQLELGAGRPILLINKNIPDLGTRLASDPVLQGAILPAALREITRELVRGSAEDDEEWVVEWTAYLEGLVGEELVTELTDDELSELIRRVVDAFDSTQRWAWKARPQITQSEADYE